jgi:hypothetical protein
MHQGPLAALHLCLKCVWDQCNRANLVAMCSQRGSILPNCGQGTVSYSLPVEHLPSVS